MIIRRIRAFAKRPPADRTLLLHACALHAVVAAGCRLLRFGSLSRALARVYPPRGDVCIAPDTAAESRIVLAVATAAQFSPLGSTCLTTALATQCLLRRCGGDAVLRFGVRAGTPPAAHAWLESAGRVLAGGPSSDYLALD